ncbi:MAG: polyhydroxyalkanoate synthesis regulator DNA-binding domain-containing protein [Thermodesulfobacteriota bacterium]
MVTIKRYANGRFYDTQEKTFIRRDQIAGMIAAKKRFVIVDTKSGDDITEEITAQILAKEGAEAKQGARAAGSDAGSDSGSSEGARSEPGGFLLEFLRKSGDSLFQWGRKYAARGQDLLSESWQELDRRINRLVSEKKISEGEGRDLKEEIFRHSETLRSWLGTRVERAVEEMTQRMNLVSREELDALDEKIKALEQRVARLEKKR